MALDPNRLFPPDPATRQLYATVSDLPIISPHGHTDPRWFAENERFPDPAQLFMTPDHYVFRMLFSQGVQHYANELLDRYVNPAIRHWTWEIAMDGSQKLPQRILGKIANTLAARRACDGLFLAGAAWMRYVVGIDERGQPIDVRDPLAERLRAVSDQGGSPGKTVDALLSVAEVFGPNVDPLLRDGVLAAYQRLIAHGAVESARVIA